MGDVLWCTTDANFKRFNAPAVEDLKESVQSATKVWVNQRKKVCNRIWAQDLNLRYWILLACFGKSGSSNHRIQKQQVMRKFMIDRLKQVGIVNV